MKNFLIIFLFVLATSEAINAQNNADERAILSNINILFDGMRTSDSSMVSSVFLSNASMQTVVEDENGISQLRSGSLPQFLKAVGTPKNTIWDERIANVEIKIDGALAMAWVPYSFYAGDRFSHCGVNQLQFIKKDGAWKIFTIVDTRRPTNCIADL
ncbi:nuclear transport factor 2 family protein [Balneola vulgaris]|uniref:nuclear transport factor 2 family protein n=1 Tax=Balneola vulgaris TaxID=287535 RepID=UPI00037803BE|nr:nuclear transport factor 2 family protein [Balneola vulgaris]